MSAALREPSSRGPALGRRAARGALVVRLGRAGARGRNRPSAGIPAHRFPLALDSGQPQKPASGHRRAFGALAFAGKHRASWLPTGVYQCSRSWEVGAQPLGAQWRHEAGRWREASEGALARERAVGRAAVFTSAQLPGSGIYGHGLAAVPQILVHGPFGGAEAAGEPERVTNTGIALHHDQNFKMPIYQVKAMAAVLHLRPFFQ
jgi:hypothetical protein